MKHLMEMFIYLNMEIMTPISVNKINSNFKRVFTGAEEWLRAIDALAEDPVWLLALIWCLITTSSASFRGSDSSFWPL